MKYIFIMNEIAGRGRCKKILPNINQACKSRNIDYDIRYISKEKSAGDIAREYNSEENIIYVVGGDGTLSRTLEGIVGTKNKLGIIPAGSGNDTYRTIKNMPKGSTDIDLGKINDMYFINVACCGIDAEIANNIEKFRSSIIPTSQLYNFSMIYTYITFKFKKVKLKTSIKNIENCYTILSICNGSYYGGGFNIAPHSDLTDRILDVFYIEKMPKIKMLPFILKLKKGTHEGKRRVHKYRTDHVELAFEEDVVFNVDGEQLKSNNFVIDILPKAITLYNNPDFVNEILTGTIKSIEKEKIKI